MKIWFQRIALLCASLLVALILAETVVRLAIHVPRGTPYVAENPDTLYDNKPNITGRHVSPGEFNHTFKTNSLGFRSAELRAKQAAVPHILCLGDSFTFGIGAGDAETWPAQLQSLLNHTGRTTEVVNGGVMGWGLAEYWIWTSLHAAKIRPQWIIVACHAGDWENAANGLVSLKTDGTLERHQVVRKDISRLKAMTEHIPFYDTLMTHSAIANLLKQAVVRSTHAGTTRGVSNSEVASSIGDADWTKDQFHKLSPVNRALLRGLQQVATEAGARLLVAFIPSYREMEPGGDGQAGYRLFREQLQAWTRELELPYVDTTSLLLEHLEKHSVPVSSLYHLKNEHCTATGYEVIARGLFEKITEHPEWLAGTEKSPALER